MTEGQLTDLTPEDSEALQRIVEKLTQESPRPWTLQRLLDNWRRTVLEVESGYQLTVDNYTNDLYKRNLLQAVLDAAPDSLQEKVMSVLAPIDDRFLRATRDDAADVLEHFCHRPRGWWWRRLPLIITGNLAANFKGLV